MIVTMILDNEARKGMNAGIKAGCVFGSLSREISLKVTRMNVI